MSRVSSGSSQSGRSEISRRPSSKTSVCPEHFTDHGEVQSFSRGDIEKKKEDLRNMVGRRYRDLIEAADSIKDMKNSSDQVESPSP